MTQKDREIQPRSRILRTCREDRACWSDLPVLRHRPRQLLPLEGGSGEAWRGWSNPQEADAEEPQEPHTARDRRKGSSPAQDLPPGANANRLVSCPLP